MGNGLRERRLGLIEVVSNISLEKLSKASQSVSRLPVAGVAPETGNRYLPSTTLNHYIFTNLIVLIARLEHWYFLKSPPFIQKEFHKIFPLVHTVSQLKPTQFCQPTS